MFEGEGCRNDKLMFIVIRLRLYILCDNVYDVNSKMVKTSKIENFPLFCTT